MRGLVFLGLALVFPLLALWQLQRTIVGRSGALRDRAELLLVLAAGVLFLLFSRSVTNWESVPPVLWLVSLLLLVAAVGLSGRAWPELAWIKSPRPGLRAVSTAVQVLLAGAVVLVLL